MNKKQSTTFLYKIMIFVTVLSIVPVIVVGIFSYIKSAEIIESHVDKNKQHSVYQIQTNIEQILKTVDHSLTHYVNSSQLKQALREPIYPEQFQLYNQIRAELGQLQTIDTKLADILLISFQNKWLINNYGLQRLSVAQYEEFKGEKFSLPTNSLWILEKRQTDLYKSSVQGNCLYDVNLIKPIPLTSTNKTGVAIAQIPACNFNEILKQSQDLETFFILDANMQVISHSDPSKIGDNFSNKIVTDSLQDLTTDNGQLHTTIEGIKYKFTYRKSSYNNWTYISLIELNELNKQSKSIGWFTFIICSLIVGISLFFAFIGSRKIYQPVKHLHNVILTSLQPNDEKQAKNEFELIEIQIKRMLEQNIRLEDLLGGQIAQLKQFFMLRLLDGKVKQEELPAKLISFNFPQDWTRLSVLTLQIDSLENTSFQNKESDLLLFIINTFIEELIPSTHRLTPIVKNQAQVTVLLSDHETDEQYNYYLNNIATTIQQRVKLDFDIPVSIGISTPFTDISHVKNAYKEGLEALKYTLKFGTESIIFFENLNRNTSFHTFFPKQIKNELFDAIKICDRENVDRLLNELLKAIFEKDLNHLQYHISVIRFLNDLLELTQNLGIDVLDLEDNKAMFDQIYDLKSLSEVRNWFHEMIISPLITKIEMRSESQYKNISDNIVHIVQEEFDTDLTLESIAIRLHYNPNYLSSIFRKEMNISFSEYLSLYRLNMAKQWLTDTKLSVKEISERLNYNNSQNFIRSFRKSEGTTPGKYREQKKNL